MIAAPVTPTELVCQACHRPIGDRPAVLCPAPAGGTEWALHRDARDCMRALAKASRPCQN